MEPNNRVYQAKLGLPKLLRERLAKRYKSYGNPSTSRGLIPLSIPICSAYLCAGRNADDLCELYDDLFLEDIPASVIREYLALWGARTGIHFRCSPKGPVAYWSLLLIAMAAKHLDGCHSRKQ